MADFCHMRSGTGQIGFQRIPRTEKEEHRVSAEEDKAITSHMNEELWSNMAVTSTTPRPSVTEKPIVQVAPSPALTQERSGL